MKKKLDLFLYLGIILILIFLILILYSIFLNKELKKCNNKNICNNEITDNNTITNDIINNNTILEKEYNCSFTTTYRIVDLLDNYIAEVPEYSYIVVDKFQIHNAIAHYIPTKLKEDLEINKNYEFTYHIKGKGNINNIYDVINNIHLNHLNNDNLSVTLTIKETDKLGLDQIQENICN